MSEPHASEAGLPAVTDQTAPVHRGRGRVTRADLPDEFTPESLRKLPLGMLRQLRNPHNGVLTTDEQASFDAALHEMMSHTANRVSNQMSRSDWARMMNEAGGGRPRGPGGRPGSQDEQNLRRIARRIEQQVDAVEDLAPGVDWSFAQAEAPASETSATSTDTDSSDETQTVDEIEQHLSDQVELVQVMSEIAAIQRRTYALEQQRDLQSTRSVFFGFVVSVAVLVAGWAPIVATHEWAERWWILGLTVATCLLAGLVYALVRLWQNRHQSDADADADASG